METSEYNTIATRMDKLWHNGVKKAVGYAKTLPEDDFDISQLKAATLVDGGSELRCEETIIQGKEIFERLIKHDEAKVQTSYNLANALSSLTTLHQANYNIEGGEFNYQWFLDTIKDRLTAKSLFGDVVGSIQDRDLISSAYNNRANMLNASWRWIEAKREYEKALDYDNSNGVAAGGIIKIVMSAYWRGMVHQEILPIIIPSLFKSISNGKARTIKLSGLTAFKAMMSELEQIGVAKIPTQKTEYKLVKLSPYQKFIFKKKLYLNPVMPREVFEPDICDSLVIDGFIPEESIDKYKVPNIFGMFNIIKADYLTARWLAFCYFNEELPKNSFYHDTLDYAVYGSKPSLLTLSQKLTFDILDKIAVATLSMFDKKRMESASFRNAWFHQKTNEAGKKIFLFTQWSQEISTEINKGNLSLIALTELSYDIYDHFRIGHSHLKRKHRLRNSSTHRFSIIHDFGFTGEYKDGPIDHYGLKDIENELIDTLFMVKAAIIYFLEVIYCRNSIIKSETKGIFGDLYVPSHKKIRGQKS